MAADRPLLTAKLLLLICVPSCVLVCTLLGLHSTQTDFVRVHCTPIPTHAPITRHHSQRVVLVTGAAGFVGYHTSRALVDNWKATVVGLDLFTDYYDPQLKHDRANELIKIGVTLYRGDVCDTQLLLHLFERYQFTDVIHLAAQAGVRHSLKDPVSYLRNNIECFQVLLDALKQFNETSLVYASSSSVYGRSAPLPFSTLSPPNPPSSIYAASKQANELFSKTYCTQYGIRSIGLRLFTVYGPWGRPDMAVYKFTDSIANKRPIPMFTASQALKRDFTFVNDTVGVFLAALDHTPQCCGEVYNAGLGEPESLPTLVKLLEEELNSTAHTDPSPLMSCDLHVTWADMEETKRVLGYTPRVKLRDGLREFIAWYKHYHSQRVPNETRERLKELYEGEVIAMMANGNLEQINRKYGDRINGLKQRYYQYAGERGIPLPVLTKRRFIFYPGKESPGHTVIKAPSYRGNLKLLEERCLATEQCIAFTSLGEFKNRVSPMNKWVPIPEGHGMYVADIDLCASDLHFCGKHSGCVYTGPANYTCVCHHGYLKLGQYCVERYVQGDVGATEEEWILSDQFDGFNWEEAVRGRAFVFFQGLDSPGGDYLVVEGRSLEELREVCLSTRHCLAFNTNGILKDSLRPPSGWGRWAGPQYPQHGLYVLDIDYCSLNLEQCHPHSICLRHSPGNYSCTCLPPWIPIHDHSCALDLVHIILSTDTEQLPGLIGVINSTLNHAQHSEQIVFHIVFTGERLVIESYLSCYGYNDYPQIDITIFNASLITEPIQVYSRISEVGHLASPGNFARFYFHLLFPELSRAVYLDVDIVVLGDVAEVWSKLQTADTLLVAAPRISPTYGDMLSVHVKKLFRERYQREFRSDDVTFNAGVYGVNLDLWRENRIHDEVAYWMHQQAKAPLWKYGTQPIMLLVAHGQWGHLDPHWNVNGLGWNTEMSRRDLDEAKLLHWSGKGKPWLSDGLYKDLWHAHNPPSCSGHGQCITMETGIYTCHCDGGHTGELCSQQN